MDLTLIVYQLIAGLIIGFTIGMTGIGGGVLGVLPMIFLIFFFQRYMVKGLTAGAVKG